MATKVGPSNSNSSPPIGFLQMARMLQTLRRIRFGVFECDCRLGELLKAGRRVKLQGQPIQILSVLLERRGELVTREELQKRLWPADTFVDFEHSRNGAAKRLRQGH